jgi:ABC-2 type transport system ATP-binding protein
MTTIHRHPDGQLLVASKGAVETLEPLLAAVEVLGLDPRRDGLRLRRLGYLPGELALYERLTGQQLLEFFAALRGVPDLKYGQELAERFGLDLSRPIHALSKGNKQKLGLVQALQHRPELLVLDEPTSGLDPLVQQPSTPWPGRWPPKAAPCSCPRTC